MTGQDHADVIVVGGGVVGLWIALRTAQGGARVTVVDPVAGRGASWTAAGMLAPVTEYTYGEDSLLALTLLAAAQYPAAVADLAEVSGTDAGYRQCGALEVGWDAADLLALRELSIRREQLGLTATPLTSRQLRKVEPGLAAGLPGGTLASDDHQVDNRRMVCALLTAVTALGVRIIAQRVARLRTDDLRCTGVQVADGALLDAEAVVVAAGAYSGRLSGLPHRVRVPVRPVKGQTLRLRCSEPVVEHIIRGRVRGTPVYVVPRADGEIVLGASTEETGFESTPRTGAVHDLLRDATVLVPGLTETTWVEVSTGLRPGTPDNLPLVGPTDVRGLWLATGHYRNGILLAPLTGAVIAAGITGTPVGGWLAGETVPQVVAEMSPERFSGSTLSPSALAGGRR